MPAWCDRHGSIRQRAMGDSRSKRATISLRHIGIWPHHLFRCLEHHRIGFGLRLGFPSPTTPTVRMTPVSRAWTWEQASRPWLPARNARLNDATTGRPGPYTAVHCPFAGLFLHLKQDRNSNNVSPVSQ